MWLMYVTTCIKRAKVEISFFNRRQAYPFDKLPLEI